MDLQVFVTGYLDSLKNICGQSASDSLNLKDVDADLPTDLPGWSVRDILAHLVHLEEVLATGTDLALANADNAGVSGSANKGSGVGPDYTQLGVDAYKHQSVTELLKLLRDFGRVREEQLTPPPSDPKALAPNTPAGANWDNQTVLRNRMLDLWVHEQDLRRALNQPLRFTAPAAVPTLTIIAMALPMIVGKKAGAKPGQSVRVKIAAPFKFDQTIKVDNDGKARPVNPSADSTAEETATATVEMTTEEFFLAGSGRAHPNTLQVKTSGDQNLATALLNNLNIMP